MLNSTIKQQIIELAREYPDSNQEIKNSLDLTKCHQITLWMILIWLGRVISIIILVKDKWIQLALLVVHKCQIDTIPLINKNGHLKYTQSNIKWNNSWKIHIKTQQLIK